VIGRLVILLGGIALGAALYALGTYVGGRMDSAAYPEFAAQYGVDCSGKDWRVCETMLESAKLESILTNTSFDPPSNSRRLALLGGAFGLAVALAAFRRRR
jgi:hypothetical protein